MKKNYKEIINSLYGRVVTTTMKSDITYAKNKLAYDMSKLEGTFVYCDTDNITTTTNCMTLTNIE